MDIKSAMAMMYTRNDFKHILEKMADRIVYEASMVGYDVGLGFTEEADDYFVIPFMTGTANGTLSVDTNTADFFIESKGLGVIELNENGINEFVEFFKPWAVPPHGYLTAIQKVLSYE